jgi:N-acetylmuramoyl-L-alanine amidase
MNMIGKWLLLISILLIVTAQVTWAASEQPVAAILDGHPLDPQVRVIERDGNAYINLPILSQYLNIITAWNIEAHDLFLKFGKLNIKLYANDATYYINGNRQQLSTAPFEASGQFWLPVQFLTKIGLVIKSQSQQQITLDWAQNYLLGVESTTYQNRPAFLLIGTKNLQIKDTVLTQPDRLVLNLPGVTTHFAMDEQIDTSPASRVKQISFDHSNPDGIKINFDLNQATGYQLIPMPDQPNRVILVFNYLLTDINVFSQDDEHKIIITCSASAEYQIKTVNANHLTLDLVGATLAGKTSLLSGDGVWSRSVQLRQLNQQMVRVELELFNSSTPCYVVHSPGNPNLLEIRPVQIIKQVNWVSANEGSLLHITSNGEIFALISQTKTTGSIEIILNDVHIAPGLILPDIKNSLVNGIFLTTINPESFRLTIPVNRFVNYKVEYSANRRSLTFRFKRSPLVGKIIVLDPGHGGEDSGAWGRQIREKDVNLEIAMRLKDRLEAAGAAVVLTRTDDYFVGLYERPYLANYLLADLFISIHTNNHPDLTVHGIEVFHYPGHQASQLLAKDILADIAQNTGLVGLGVKQDDFVVIRESQMPSILVEVGFLSNFQEENTIKTPQFKDNAAMGIYQGILDYYTP